MADKTTIADIQQGFPERIKDMGDSTYARVVAAYLSGAIDGERASGVSLSVTLEGTRAAYTLAGIVTPAATPTDVITIAGSASKVVRVVRAAIYPVATAAGIVPALLLRRSTANSGGTSSSPTIGQHATADNAPTAVVKVYTANPAGLGTLVANLGAKQTSIVTSGGYLPLEFDGVRDGAGALKPYVLVGTTDILAINGNGATLLAGETWGYEVSWTEDLT